MTPSRNCNHFSVLFELPADYSIPNDPYTNEPEKSKPVIMNCLDDEDHAVKNNPKSPPLNYNEQQILIQ